MPSLYDVPVVKRDESEKKKDISSLYDVKPASAVTPPGAKFDLVQDINPDTEAKVQDISRETGYNANVIREDPQAFSLIAESKKAKSIAGQHKGLSLFSEDLNNAALVKDDLEALAEVEKIVVDPAYKYLGFGDPVGEVGLSFVKQSAKFIPRLAASALDITAMGFGTLDAAASAFEGLPTVGKRGGWFGQLETLSIEGSKNIKKFLEETEILNLPEELQGRLIENPQYLLDPEWMTYNVGEVAGSLVPVLAAAYVGGPTAGAVMGSLMEGGDLYTQLRRAGVSEEDASNAAIAFGLIVGKLNKIGLDRMLKQLPTGSALVRMVHRAVTGATEGFTEWAEEPFQAAIASIAQGESLEDAGDAAVAALSNVEVIPGSVILGVGLNTSISEAVAAKDKTAGYLDHQKDINEAVNATKTKERSPDAVKRFLKTTGLGDEAFISPDGVWSLYQTDPKTAKDILSRVGLDPEEAINAARAGQSVQVETSSLHAILSPEEFSLISEDLKPSPGAYSQREIQDRTATNEISRLTKLYAEAEQNEEEFNAELERTREQVKSAVTGLTRFEGVDIDEYAEEVVRVQQQRANTMEMIDGIDRVDYLRRVNIVGAMSHPGAISQDIFELDQKEMAQVEIEVRFPGHPAQKAAEEFNAKYPGHSIRFDGTSEAFEDIVPETFQYTPLSGPIKGASFNAADSTVGGFKTAYRRMLKQWKEEITFEQGPAVDEKTIYEVYAPDGEILNSFNYIEKARRWLSMNAVTGAYMVQAVVKQDPLRSALYVIYDESGTKVTTEVTKEGALELIADLGPGHYYELNKDRRLTRYEVYDDNSILDRIYSVAPGEMIASVQERAVNRAEKIGGRYYPVYYSTKAEPYPAELEHWNVFDVTNNFIDQFPGTSKAEALAAAMEANGYAEAQYKLPPVEDDPDVLLGAAKSKYTLKIFEDPMLKGKEGKQVKMETIVQVLRQKGTPKATKEIVGQVMINELNLNQEQGEGVHKLLTDGKIESGMKEEILDITVDYSIFKATVEGALMPLDPIETSRWADYGVNLIGRKSGDYDKIESVVYNTPVPHGFGDHFNSLFETHKRKEIREWEIREVPQRPGVYVALDKARPSTNDPIELEPFVGSAGSKAQVEKWVEEYNTRILVEKAGVFGHVRRMDVSYIRYLTEMQADPFQKRKISELLTQFVLENPEGKAQKKIVKAIAKRQKVIEDIKEIAPEVIKSHETADSHIREIKNLEELIRVRKAEILEIEIKIRAALESGVDIIRGVEGVPGPMNIKYAKERIELRRERIKRDKRRIDSLKGRMSDLAEGVEAREDTDATLTLLKNELASLRKRLDITIQEQEDGMSVAGELENINESIDKHQRELVSLKASTALTVSSFKKQYEKVFYAKRDISKAEKSIPKIFTPIQKQFVAHRKNYTERLLREEIRAASVDGMEHLRVGTMRTTAVIEGFIRVQPENAEVGEFNGMYEVTRGDPEDLDPGDTIDYLDEEYTIVEVRDNAIVVVLSNDVHSFSVSDFIYDEVESSWENTGYELPNEYEIHITRIVPEHDPRERMLPGFPEPVEPPDPPGVELYDDGDFIFSSEIEPDEWYGDVGSDDIESVLKDYVESNSDQLLEDAGAEAADTADMSEYDYEYSVEVNDHKVSNEFYDIVGDRVQERYSDVDDIVGDMEDRGYGNAWTDSGVIYHTDADFETLPLPEDVANEPLDEDEISSADMEAETEEEFDLDSMDEAHQTVLKNYEETGKMMKEMYPDSYEIVKDEKGFWWHQIDIDKSEKDKPVQLFQAARGSVSNTGGEYTINIFSKADPSTVFHELGHIFMLEMKDYVESGRVSDQTMRDYKTILKFVGSESGEITREHHEKFARAFELYIFEGKAPSIEMERSFSRMRRWMVALYRRAKALNVTMTDQMRRIFDRMLVVEVDIAKAANVHGFTPKTQEELDKLGVIPEDQRYMKRLVDEAKQSAESKMLKAMNKGHRANKAKWLSDATKQVLANPIYQVTETISKSQGLDRDALVDSYGPDILELMPSNWYRKKGTHPDEIALAAGFDSGETMLGQILSAPTKNEAIKQIMDLKRQKHDATFKAEDYLFDTKAYGDYLTMVNKYYDGPVAEEAKKVDPNIKADGKLRKKPMTPKTISRESMKRFAREAMDDKSVRDAVRHDRYMGAMKKAQNMETQAILKGDMLGAAKAAEKVRFNYELAALALKNRRIMEKGIKFAKTAAQSKGVKLPYREQVRQLIWRFSLAEGITPQRPDRLLPLKELIMGNEFGSSAFPTSDFILNETIKPYQDLSYAQFTEVNNLIHYLVGMGRDQQRALLSDKKTRVEDAAMESALESAELPAKKMRERFSMLRKMNDLSRIFFSRLDSLNFFAIAKGAYQNVGRKGVRSRTEELIIDPLLKAQNDKDIMSEMVFARMQPHMDQVHRTLHQWEQQYGRKIRIEGVNPPPVMALNGQTGWWTGDQIFSVILNIGNDSNVSRLTKGYPTLTLDKVKVLLNMLSVDDMVAVQGIWDTINSLYPELDAVHTRINYFHMSKIEARPFTFRGKKFNGGYYPVHFDPRLSRKVASFSEADDLMSRSEAIRQIPATKSGMTVSRKEGVALPLNLSLGVATRHINDTVRYITHAEAVRDVDRITQNDAFADETTRLLGKDVFDMVRAALKHIARPSRHPVDPQIDRWVERSRMATTAFILGLNASVAAKQMFSSPAAMHDMGPINYFRGFLKIMDGPSDAYNLMMEMSPYMRQRGKTMDRELQDFFNKMGPERRAIWFGDKSYTWNDVRNFGFTPIRIVDMATVIPIWRGAFDKTIRDTDGDADAAVAYADDIVRRTQPSAQPLDLTNWQRAGGYFRFLSLFQTFTVGKYGQRQRLHYRAWRHGNMTSSEYAWFNFCDVVLPGIMMQVLFTVLWGKDFDEETWKDIAKQAASYALFTGMPVIGNFFSKYGGPLDSPIASTADLFQRAMRDGYKYIQSRSREDMERLAWDMAHISSFASGLPLSKVVEKAVKGHEQDQEYIPGIKYLIPAPKK